MRRPRVLSVAGSDPSGGAGLQADLAVFAAFRCHGAAVVAGLTVQDSRGVRGATATPEGSVGEQLESVFSDGPPAAAKTGMLARAAAVRAAAEAFSRSPATPLVVDPVSASSGGFRLIDEDAEREILRLLVPIAWVVTPNAVEAAVMTGAAVIDVDGAVVAARKLVERGARAALVKGGHLPGRSAIDVLVERDGSTRLFERERIETIRRVRGTGCALSAAIAASLAHGLSVADAVAAAGDWVHEAIRGAYEAGPGALLLDRSVPAPGIP